MLVDKMRFWKFIFFVFFVVSIQSLTVTNKDAALIGAKTGLMDAAYFPLKTSSKVSCFLIRIPDDPSKWEMANASYEEVTNRWHAMQRKGTGENPKAFEAIPKCVDPSPCVKKMFNYYFPIDMYKSGMNTAASQTYEMQKLFMANYPESCTDCDKLVKFVSKLPVVVREVNKTNVIQCVPVVQIKAYKISESLFLKIQHEVEQIANGLVKKFDKNRVDRQEL